jgi:acetolactate synthase regulatory subunit
MRRQHVISTITMLALCGLLVTAAMVGWNALFADLPGDQPTDSAAPTCTPEEIKAGERIRSRQVTVSVYNGGTRDGLAERTLRGLKRRGFVAGDVGNAPSDINVRRVQVWSTVEKDARARLVARQFGKRTTIRHADEALGPGVDVIVGNRFNGLVKAKRSLRVRSEQEVCLPERSRSSRKNADTAAGTPADGS